MTLSSSPEMAHPQRHTTWQHVGQGGGQQLYGCHCGIHSGGCKMSLVLFSLFFFCSSSFSFGSPLTISIYKRSTQNIPQVQGFADDPRTSYTTGQATKMIKHSDQTSLTHQSAICTEYKFSLLTHPSINQLEVSRFVCRFIVHPSTRFGPLQKCAFPLRAWFSVHLHFLIIIKSNYFVRR